jgi:hypothetical protein
MTLRPTTASQIIKELNTINLVQEFNENNKIWGILEVVPTERHDELAELCSEFCRHHGVFLQFVSHVVQHEVHLTKDSSVLFREDCFAIKTVNRLLFGDYGRKYLTKLVQPVIKAVTSTSHVLSIGRDVSGKELEKNMKQLAHIVETFLDNFAKSPIFCPPLFREVFSEIQKAVEKKFPNTDNPMVLDFIFFKFICPAIIDPKKYEIIEFDQNLPANASRSLINISKLLNDLTHKMVDKYEEPEYASIKQLIEKRHTEVKQNLKLLLDESEIAKVKNNMVNAEAASSETDKEHSEKQLKDFLENILKNPSPLASVASSRVNSISLEDLEGIRVRQILRLQTLILSSDWKKIKEAKGLSFFTMKKEDSEHLLIKVEGTFKVPMSALYDHYKNFETTIDAYKSIDLYMKHTIFEEGEGYGEYALHCKYPFPFTNREDVFSIYHELDNKRAYVVMDAPKKSHPREKGFVRTVRNVGGFTLEEHPKNPKHTIIANVLNVNIAGSVPAWLSNMFGGMVVTSAIKEKEKLEKSLGSE